jgi:DNA-binding NtrC family response regulator
MINSIQQSSEAKPHRILIVDDEEAIAAMLGESVSLLGHEPKIFTSPINALTALAKEDFDVVLTDMHMPKMNGIQLYEKVIENKPKLASKFIFLTGDTVSEEMVSLLEKSDVKSLPKPFKLAKLEETINQVLGEQGKHLIA